jgi:hypothetical protein
MPVDYERFRRTGDRIPQYGKQMQRCEMTNFEVMIVKSENGKKEMKICDQCRPEDGVYAY